MDDISRGRLINALESLQQELIRWEKYNFPNTFNLEQFIGIVEEVGELAHYVLKSSQGIREAIDKKGNKVSVKEKMEDAVGDIAIFLINYCSHVNIDFGEALMRTWDEVKQRDWRKYPIDGVSE